MKNIYVLFLFLIPGITFSQVDPVLSAKLQASIEQQLAEIGSKGIAAAVMLPDNEIWSGATGISSLLSPLNTNHTFGIGSVTKSVTAATLAELETEGVLSLDDLLIDWIPGFTNVDSAITIRQCLNHTAGTFDYRGDPEFFQVVLADAGKIWTAEEILGRFVAEPTFAPGTDWGYSNTNYLLAGLVIKAATGNDYWTEARNRFFVPLEMNSAYSAPFEPKAEGNLANLWFDLFGGGSGPPADVFSFGFSSNGMFSVGGAAGGIVAKPQDFAKWMKMLVTGKATTQASIDKMVDYSNGYPYGLGIYSEPFEGTTRVGHGGNILYASEVFYMPDYDISIAVCTNDGSKPNMEPIFTAVYKAYLDYLNPSSIEETGTKYAVSTYPNPVTEQVNLRFNLPEASNVSATIFDVFGNRISTLNEDYLSAGEHVKSITNLTNIASGTYILKLKIGEEVYSEKLLKY